MLSYKFLLTFVLFQGPPGVTIPEELSMILGMTPSDIDKYSRIFFPITFTCFQLMYWIIYNHLSDDETLDGLIFFNGKWINWMIKF